MRLRAANVGIGLLLPASLVLFGRLPAAASDLAAVQRYELIEEWSVAAQGPVYLREKRVTATYNVDVSDATPPASAETRLRLHFVDVAVHAEIPAQKRSGSVDSRKMPERLSIEHHELVRPLALWQQTFDLTYSPQHVLRDVSGMDQAVRRLDELYDDHLPGTEQDLNTHAFERDRQSAAALRAAWAPLFLVPLDGFPADASPRQSTTDAEFVACIPSESWMTTVRLPVTETVSVTKQPDGALAVTRSSVLARQDKVETTIGNTPWSYTPQEVQSLEKFDLRPDGRVQSFSSSATAVLQTTLSLDADVPITMTIRHSRSLNRR